MEFHLMKNPHNLILSIEEYSSIMAMSMATAMGF